MNKYNRVAAANYAKKWALSANPKFYHFGGIGGDCTNFISQCLLAGGAKMNYHPINGWFYRSSYNRSASWTSVYYFHKFILANLSPGINAHIENLKNLQIGDIIQIRQKPNKAYNHTLIISKIENDEIYVCAHSDDAKNRPLSTYNYEEALGIHIVGLNN